MGSGLSCNYGEIFLDSIERNILLISFFGQNVGLGHRSRITYLEQVLARNSALQVDVLSISETQDQGLEPYFSASQSAAFAKKIAGQILESVSRKRPNVAILDLPWRRFVRSDIEFILSPLIASADITVIDGPNLKLSRPVRRVYPCISEPHYFGEKSDTFWGGENVLAPRRSSNWEWESGDRWLLLTGTTDTEKFLDKFEQLGNFSAGTFLVDWAVGPFAPEGLRERSSAIGMTWLGTDRLKSAQKAANYSLCRFGVSALEMMALGTPTIILPGWAESENGEIEEIRKSELAIVAESWDQIRPEMARLGSNRSLCAKLSRNCLEFFSEVADQTFIGHTK